MTSPRTISLPGLFALLATLALRMDASEAEWLLTSSLQTLQRLRLLAGRLPRIIHPCGC